MEFCGELVAPLHKIRRGLRAQGELKCISIGRSCDKIHWHHWAEQGGDLLACQNRLRIEGKGDGARVGSKNPAASRALEALAGIKSPFQFVDQCR